MIGRTIRGWSLLTGGPGPRSAAATYADTVLSYSPLGYWKLDETSGTTANDSSGNSRHGTYTGGYTLNDTAAPGSSMGNAVSLNGSSGYIDIYTAGLSGAFDMKSHTYSVWCRVSAASIWDESGGASVRRIISTAVNASNEATMHRYQPNQILANWWFGGGGADIVKTGMTTTGWFHVLKTVEHPTVNFYVDGTFVGTSNITVAGTSGPIAYATIGRYATSAIQYWSGWLSHAAIFDGALDASAIAALSAAS